MSKNKTILYKIFGIIILLLNSTINFSQEVTIINNLTNFPIEGVTVFNKTKKILTQTDKYGIFKLDEYIESDTIIVKHISFNSEQFTKSELKEMDYTIQLLPKIFLIEEFSVVASIREHPDELPYQIDMLKVDEIKSNNSQTSADILTATGNVIVQKSQGGGGSPILRGFEANKILLVIDGVRMNNAIYRSGHLQNSITIDQAMLDEVDIVYGPSSIIYGSDAIGGVIHYHTKKPKFSDTKKTVIHSNILTQYSTANNTKIGHLNISVANQNIASLTGVTYNDFGNIKIGKNRSFSNNDNSFGLTNHYITQNNLRIDTMLINPKPNTQLNTAYKQYDFFQKLLIEANSRLDFTLNLQYSTSTNINRYDNLTDYKKEYLEYAEWYYGPQNRLLSSISSFIKYENKLFTNLKATFAYQKINEDRISRKYKSENQKNQNEEVDVYSLNMDFFKFIGINKLHYGIEFTYNNVVSSAFYENVFDNKRTIAQTRYPDGGSVMQTASMYLNYKWMVKEELVITSGIRYNFTHLHSNFLNQPELVQLPFSKVNINNTAPTGIISFEFYPNEKSKIRTVLSSGFRTPNVDDYGKIRAKGDLVTVPNNKLKPEYVYNGEIGIQRIFSEDIKFNVSTYYNFLTNAIVRTNFQLNQQDSLLFDGDMYKIITNSNAGEAVVAGVNINFVAKTNLQAEDVYLNFKATYNYTYGINLTSDAPLAHIPPMHGLINVEYENKKVSISLNSMYQSWKYTNEMSPFGEDNQDKATKKGFPAWYSLNFYTQYDINKHLKLKFAIENIFDQMYRSFASGVSAPGRNFIFSIKANL